MADGPQSGAEVTMERNTGKEKVSGALSCFSSPPDKQQQKEEEEKEEEEGEGGREGGHQRVARSLHLRHL